METDFKKVLNDHQSIFMQYCLNIPVVPNLSVSRHSVVNVDSQTVSKTRSLLSVFEEDAGTLTDYTNQLLQAMQRVYGAQVCHHPSPVSQA
ncbi:hypothetical protein P7K49_020169 [Saguinus oedipus]|uniref:Uncharacterized protein n=1 Tax=Saguinus oedipus TaxID=9490 RepID=A0ABQ9V213_SAGOE|nr:hypothetical protein P7K49_020169 [Saguinus oedipus]